MSSSEAGSTEHTSPPRRSARLQPTSRAAHTEAHDDGGASGDDVMEIERTFAHLEDINDIDEDELDADFADAVGDQELDIDDDDDDDDDDDEFEEEEDDDQDEQAEGQEVEIGEEDLLDLLQRSRGTVQVGTGGAEVMGDFLRMLRQAGWGGLLRGLRNSAAADDDDDDDYNGEHTRGYGNLRARRGLRRSPDEFPKVPSDEGRALMESGTFGTNERKDGQFTQKKKLAARIMRRELGLGSPGKQRGANRIAAQSMIPSSQADTIINYDHRCYSGQFSDDGNFFFSCAQDFKVRMYDTSNPYSWKYYKTVTYPYGQWTITDASLSPDNRFLAYSSIRSLVCLATTDPTDSSEPHLLDFADHGPQLLRGFSHSSFGIWSIRFSGDGRELVAGTSDNSVYAYDIETRQTVLRIHRHDDDVNAVCFGDKSSPHLLYSGSDDTTLKVWDRRSMSDNREAGVFLGHTEGLTYVDSKGDGRYVISNGKDQTMKLWDLRKMMSADTAERIDASDFSTGFDYRFQPYSDAMYKKHPHDSSLVTFRGHKVLKTLIRCHFSPPGSTDSRYVYSGSEDGSVYIYNMDATLAGKVDVNKATHNTRPRNEDDETVYDYFEEDRRTGTWKTCVRDASWHPNAPVIAATSWNGYGMTQGTCTTHTWNDGLNEDEAEPAMGQRLNAVLQPSRQFYEDPQHPRPFASARARFTGLRGRGRANGYE